MLSLTIDASSPTVKSGGTLELALEVSSTRSDDVKVLLHFPSNDVRLSEPSVTIPLTKSTSAGLQYGKKVHQCTVTGKQAWYTLRATAADGDSMTQDETLISVTR